MPRYIDTDKIVYTQSFARLWDHGCNWNEWVITEDEIDDMPTADVVERSAYDQVAWERDTAIEQLRSINKGLGAKMDDVVVRKKGKWEIYVISMLDGEGCRCSECGFEGAPYWDYCSNCGADMREGENGK